MTLVYVDPVDEESSWHVPICRVLGLPNLGTHMSMNVVNISKVKYIKRAAIKKNNTNDNRSR